MSRTTKANLVSNPNEFYETPAWCTKVLLKRLTYLPKVTSPRSFTVLDPCCGRGAILREVETQWPETTTEGVEIDKDLAFHAIVSGLKIFHINFFEFPSAFLKSPGIVIMNPPFTKAMEFIHKCRSEWPGAVVAVLLRTNWLEAKCRTEFLKKDPPHVLVLNKRPSFINGKTDATSYSWMIWGDGEAGSWEVLECRA